jgi:hypothetical protein
MQITPHIAKAGVVTLGQLTGGPTVIHGSESLKEMRNNEPNRLPVAGCLQLTSKYLANSDPRQDTAVPVRRGASSAWLKPTVSAPEFLCNLALGNIKENAERARKLAEYIEVHCKLWKP